MLYKFNRLYSPQGITIVAANGYQHELELVKPNILYDNYVAYSGVSSFMHENEAYGWKYTRTNSVYDKELSLYTHIISSEKQIEGFTVILVERCYVTITLSTLTIQSVPYIYVHERSIIQTQKQV